MYNQLARFYDWPGSVDFSEQIAEKSQNVLEHHQILPPGPLLDVACGTGGMAAHFADRGWRVTAFDLSADMLSIARERYETHLTINWKQANMCTFVHDEPFSVAVCFSDSLNHLLNETELKQALTNLYEALKPGGLFLFDLNTSENFLEFWNGKDVGEGPNYRLTFVASFNPETGRARTDITVEEHTEEGLVREEEIVQEQYYPEALVQGLLENIGFSEISYEGFNPIPELFPQGQFLKTYWQCKK